MASRADADLDTLGRFVRDCRQELGLTQTQLAERVGWVQERISLIENGRYGLPSLPALARLARALNCPLQAVLAAAGYAAADVSTFGTNGSGHQGNPVLQYTLQRLLQIDAADLKGALDQASDMLAEAMGADTIDAFVYEETNSCLIALGTSNTPMGRLHHAAGLHIMPVANRGRIVEVYESGDVYASGRVEDDPEIPIGMKQTLGVRSLIAVPLWSDGGIHGVLTAESAQPNRFSPEEQQFFEAAARWVGRVARRAELTEATRQAVAQEARRLAADELITALAHDLGNYLTPLRGRIELLCRRLAKEQRVRDLEDASEAARAVTHIQQMVSRLLDVARIDQGLFALSLQPVDLASLTEQVATDMRGSWPAIETRAFEELEIEGDPVRLSEALVNLVSNAIQHSPAGAPISLDAHSEDGEHGRLAVVLITDHGTGIEAHLLPTLFDRFAGGTRSNGLGLGLYLARSIVEAHQGTVAVESSVGAGTTFRVAIPCRAAG